MYKLMIVDDDEYIRERLKGIIAFEELELSLSCEASNGQEAMDLFFQNKPDIVVTDINIPLIDGLSMARMMQQQNKNLGLVVITGYGTLEFAREAIKAGIAGFLLKPINKQELNDTLQGIIHRLEKEAQERIRMWQMESLLQESLPVLRERYLSSLLTDSLKESEKEKIVHFRKLNIPMVSGHFCVAVLLPNYLEIDKENWEAIQIAIENISGELLLEKGFTCTTFFNNTMQAVMLVQSESTDFAYKLETVLSTMRDKLRFYSTFDFYGCIGKEVSSLGELSDSYHSAIEAIQYKDFFGENNIVNIKNVFQLEKIQNISFRSDIDRLEKIFKSADIQNMENAVKQYFSRITYASGGSDSVIKRACIELMVGIRACAEATGIVLSQEDDAFFTNLFYSNSMVKTKKLLLDNILRLICALKEKRSNRVSKMVEDAKTYIEQHLTEENLNLTTVSESVGLSSVYFCSLFKKETGCTFVDYLNQSRVEKAKKLLSTTNMKIYEVSEAVGYTNSKYFFQIFKKITGRKPKEYSKGL